MAQMIEHKNPFVRALSLAFEKEKYIKDDSIIGFDLSMLNDPRRCPERFLPHLAWSLNIPVWKDGWSSEQKRDFIEEYETIRLIRGSKKSLQRAYEAIGLRDIEIVDQIQSRPFEFKVYIRPEISNIPELREYIVDITKSFSPVRTLARLQIKATIKTAPTAICLFRIRKRLRISIVYDGGLDG